MESFLNLVKSNIVAQAVLSIALGALLAFMPQVTTVTIVYLLALCVAVSGIASLISYARSKRAGLDSSGVLASGVLLLVVALIIFVFPQAVASIFSLVLGILLVVGGVVNVVRSVELRGYVPRAGLASLVISAIIAVGGMIIVINPFGTTVTFVLVLGVLLIVKGVSDLAIELSLSRATKNLR